MDLGLTGKVALVAGATSGLGLATARALAAEGAHVAFCGRREELALAEASRCQNAIGVGLDLMEEGSSAAATSRVVEQLGPIDILILNGGGPPSASAVDVDAEQGRRAAELLVHSQVTLVSQCLAGMRERQWGRVLAIGSSAVQQPIPTLATSSMFRAALAAYLKLLAEDVAADGVTVNMVHPGRIATDRIEQLDSLRAEKAGQALDEVRRASEGTIPMRRYGRPEELAAAVTFLCGEPASYITGEQLRVDGGLVRGL
jgi:3-oxoacyl-[acyl-carrier protein] reductase